MTSPVETIADALIAFIMSLLHDPDAAEEFIAQPQATLADNGLSGVCMADVAQVRPVIVDHPTVIHHENPPPSPPPGHNDPVHEIVRMIQQYTTVDARSTILDQSVNQNIWTEGGDVTQLFDQDAVVASGDHAVAAGDDATVVDSDVDVSVGDISAGNTTNDHSFNDTGSGPDDVDVDDDAADAPIASDDDVSAAAAVAGEATANAVDTAADVTEAVVAEPAPVPTPAPEPAAAPASVPEPADLLEGDMTAGGGDSYDADAASAAVNDDAPVDAPLEDD
ncbi:IniB N-terminal domain-containing protein [Microbacterium sp.]|uniref:IniB N-terminal domain-containing protein n=1 Tax=Microbacterium sp. TaxID=51671 RepID=UPI00281203CA|nr:IniB N-terminal domain-containing protein [Microbacterium sp.]